MYYVVLIFVFCSGFYIMFPYINGLGCDFNFSLESEHVKEVGKCKAGVFTSYSHNAETKLSTYNRFIYGVDSDYMYFYNLSKGEKVSSNNNKLVSKVDYEHAMTFYDGDFLYIAKYKCINRFECHLIIGENMENIYKFNVNGRPSLFYK